MKTLDQATLSQWLDADVDGELGADEARRLEKLADQDPGVAGRIATERRQLERLHGVLGEGRIEVRDEFRDQVMASLATAPWEPSESPAWRLPVAMMLFLALGAALALGGVTADNPVVGTGIAVADFLQSTVLAGAGITLASWRGAGLGLEELMATSGSNMLLFGVLVLFLDLLFLSLLLRRRAQPTAEIASGEGPGSDSR